MQLAACLMMFLDACSRQSETLFLMNQYVLDTIGYSFTSPKTFDLMICWLIVPQPHIPKEFGAIRPWWMIRLPCSRAEVEIRSSRIKLIAVRQYVWQLSRQPNNPNYDRSPNLGSTQDLAPQKNASGQVCDSSSICSCQLRSPAGNASGARNWQGCIGLMRVRCNKVVLSGLCRGVHVVSCDASFGPNFPMVSIIF